MRRILKKTIIVALRNEKGSYNHTSTGKVLFPIVALRNEKGSYNNAEIGVDVQNIVALRNEKEAIQIKKHHLNR